MTIVVTLERIFGGIREFFSVLATASLVIAWDSVLSLLNLFTPKREVGKVVLPGNPGCGGKWPKYIPPKDTDSRSACPALNTLANHGTYSLLATILPSPAFL